MPIDAHVHFFTRSLMTENAGRLLALIRAATMAEGFIRREESGMDPQALVSVIETGLRDSPAAVMRTLDDAYGPGWAYVPLMMDLEYALEDDGIEVPPANEAIPAAPIRLYQNGSSSAESEKERSLRRRIWRRVEDAWRVMFGEGLEWGARKLLAAGSFDRQRSDLTALKADCPDRVFPFLGLDPRRRWNDGTDLAELVGDYVGPGRPFAGVKLYTSAGFSPTDPALFAPGGLYDHCRRRRLPITVHFGSSGFATPRSSIRVRGDVYQPLYGAVVPADLCRFHIKMTPGTLNAAVAERQMKLNHPRLWEKVLDRWPGLVINFAHAGGSQQTDAWVEDPATPNWVAWALDQASRRRGVYVDLSGHSGSDQDLPSFLSVLRKRRPALRRKILYGSDFFLSSLKDPDIRSFRDAHQKAFGSWWGALSRRNPARFLAGGAGSRRIGKSLD